MDRRGNVYAWIDFGSCKKSAMDQNLDSRVTPQALDTWKRVDKKLGKETIRNSMKLHLFIIAFETRE